MEKTLYWKNGCLFILNQKLLPAKVKFVKCRTAGQVQSAIKEMVIRGAPAIGVAAAFGAVLACSEKKYSSAVSLKKHFLKALNALVSARPTAVNLFWAVERMKNVFLGALNQGSAARVCGTLENEAKRIYAGDIKVNLRIGENGAKLFKKPSKILTHCNAGALATAGYGTALGVIRSAHKRKNIKLVYVDETRPYLQGMRLTAWEMVQEKIPHKIITDNMAGYMMGAGEVDAVIVGADRIAANGDTANKIGTYPLAILAKYHAIPFYVAAPTSTVDIKTPSGNKIKIEERSQEEVTHMGGILAAPKKSEARHPAFDVTPANLITAIITENGVFKPQYIKNSL